MTILNQKKEKFNSESKDDIPTYICDYDYEEYRKLRQEQKIFLGVNVWEIDRSVIKK